MRLGLGVVAVFAAVLAFSQERPPVKEFEVVSIRVVPELTMQERTRDPQNRAASIRPGLVRMPYESMRNLLMRAFGVSRTQLSAPDWSNTKYYAIEAKMPAGAALSDVPEMLKSMLSTRFGLGYHTEVRSVAASFLTVRKGGLTAKPATPESKRAFRPLQEPGASHNELPATTAELAQYLSQVLGVPVIDNTGSVGPYLFVFDVYPFGRGGADTKGSHDFTGDIVGRYDDGLAPLGLQLELKKSPLETVVIDRLAAAPTEN
jgi:uncharacterized protein (TIGR03435 family)